MYILDSTITLDKVETNDGVAVFGSNGDKFFDSSENNVVHVMEASFAGGGGFYASFDSIGIVVFNH